MDQSFSERNDHERVRLRQLIERLDEADLGRELGGGWTIAALLAHLAFWDRYALAVLETWQRSGVAPRTGEANEINVAELPVWRALPPRAAVAAVLEAASTIDERVSTLPTAVVEAVVAAGRLRILDRSLHRQAHIEEIERFGGSRIA
ncbi:MAG: DinB family protein [Chloroflexi bacterium]|nr:DinB family protein [Chloroflexota bacterium]